MSNQDAELQQELSRLGEVSLACARENREHQNDISRLREHAARCEEALTLARSTRDAAVERLEVQRKHYESRIHTLAITQASLRIERDSAVKDLDDLRASSAAEDEKLRKCWSERLSTERETWRDALDNETAKLVKAEARSDALGRDLADLQVSAAEELATEREHGARKVEYWVGQLEALKASIRMPGFSPVLDNERELLSQARQIISATKAELVTEKARSGILLDLLREVTNRPHE